MSDRLDWLHGWPRLGDNGTSVLIGTGVYCVGCGKSRGVTTVAFPEDWQPPGPDPDWPFPEDACPVCALVDEVAKLVSGPAPRTWPRGKPRPLP